MEDDRQNLAFDFAQRLVSGAAQTYPDLPVLEATQLKAHDLREAGVLTEPQHHHLFMVAAWDALDQPGRAVAPEELAARLAASLAANAGLFSSDELRRLARVRLDPGRGSAEDGV
jgi:hypothetical protein